MCRSIKTLRPPVLPEEATEEEIRAAALQYVRKVSGFRAPAAHNREVFDRAVEAIAAATAELLDGLEVRGPLSRSAPDSTPRVRRSPRPRVRGSARTRIRRPVGQAPVPDSWGSGRRIRYAAPAPAPNSARNDTPVANQLAPSHWPPK